MDSKVNFTLVGAFLFTFISALVIFTFWLGKYGNDIRKVNFYKIDVEESISGLNIESSVKYKGLNVGVVRQININPNNAEQIEILIEIKDTTPIKIDTVAVLESQGITGLKYIDLIGGSQKAPLLISSKDKISIIKSQLSLLGGLSNSAHGITTKVNNILKKIDNLLSKSNINNIGQTLDNTQHLTSNLNKSTKILNNKMEHILNTLDNTLQNSQDLTAHLNNSSAIIDNEIEHTINQINLITNSVNKTLDNINNVVGKDVKGMVNNIEDASKKAQKIFNKLSQDIHDGKFNLKDITNDSLKRFDILMMEWDKTMQNAQGVIEKYKESPSDLIFKRREDDFGPGEKNE